MRNTLTIIVLFFISFVVVTFDTPVVAKGKVSIKSRIRQGKSLFDANGCLDCHVVGGKGNSDGIKLDGIGKRRTKKFLQEHLRDPEEHVKTNSSTFHGDPNLMPNPNLSDKDVKLIVEYLLTLRS